MRSGCKIDDAPAMTKGIPSQDADTGAAPTALLRRIVRRFWLPSETTAVRAHMRGLTWQPWAWVAGVAFDVPGALYVYPKASLAWVLGLRLAGVPLQPLVVHLARREGVSDEAVLVLALAYTLLANVIMALQGVALGGLESAWVLGVLGFTFAGSLVADVRPVRVFQSMASWIVVWVTVMIVAGSQRPDIAAQLRSPRSLLVFVGYWTLVIAALGASVHFGLRLASLRHELTLARRMARYRLQARIGVGGMNEVWLA
jgi:hypothetical protein